MADASLPDMRARSRPGTAIAAMMPMIATTISSSMRVKPLAFRIFISDSIREKVDCRRRCLCEPTPAQRATPVPTRPADAVFDIAPVSLRLSLMIQTKPRIGPSFVNRDVTGSVKAPALVLTWGAMGESGARCQVPGARVRQECPGPRALGGYIGGQCTVVDEGAATPESTRPI